MKKVTLLMALILFCSWQFVLAQKTITGTVTDAKDGSTIPGVNVVVKGTTAGTTTDLNGIYSIKAAAGQTLHFSFIGYTDQDVVVGAEATINVKLEPSLEQLQEVVVTALGISREQKALGYAVTSIDSKDLTKTGTTSFATALYGKAPGVRIAQTPGGSTSAVNINIRGVNSITGRNQPLIVVDGVPIRDGEVQNNNYWNDQRLRGNGLLDINPEDIDNISILKGASAAALYGSEAVNGVVLITTKSGKGTKGWSVDLYTTYSADKIAYLPRYQTERGAGAPLNVNNAGQDEAGFIYYDTDGDGVKETRGILGFSINFGPKFDGKPIMSWDGQIRPYENQEDNYSNLFQTGLNSSTTVAMTNATDNSNVRLSVTHQDNKGVSLGSENVKNIANLNSSFKLGKSYTVDMVVNYINQKVTNRPYSIDRLTNNFTGMMGRFDNGDWYLDKYKTSKGYRFVTGAGTQSLTPEENIIYNGMRGDITDFVWRVNENNSVENSNRLIGSLTNTWQITDGLKLRGRIATDYTTRGTENSNTSEIPLAFGYSGYFGMESYQNNIRYGDIMLMYMKKVTQDIEIGAMVGYTGQKETGSSLSRGTSGGLSTENLFDLAASVNTPGSGSSRYAIVKDAVLGTVNGNYKNYLFIEGTLRNDRTSTMNPENNSFFYPSVNSSFVFSEAFTMPEAISYGKFRASWGIVGNYPDMYSANIAYNQNTLGVQAVGGQPVLYTTIPGSMGNDAIRPEEKHEYEFGLETKFFVNRLGFDIAYYNGLIKDQILPLTIPTSSGASSVLTNIGTLRNQGIEIALSGTPVLTTNFKWDVQLNFSKNKNVVEKLASGSDELLHADYDGNAAQLISKVGEPMGDFYAHPVKLAANGGKIVNPDGLYQVDADTMVKIGNAMPKAVGGFINTFTYKGFTLEALVDFRFGGYVMPTALNWMTSRGLTEISTTAMDKEHGGLSYYVTTDANGNTINVQTDGATGPDGEKVYDDGILQEGVKADGTPNDYIASSAYYYWNVYNWGGPQYSYSRYELYIVENSYIKMRELSLTYALPVNVAKKIGAKNISLSVFGRNLFYFYRTIKDMDAEAATAGSRWFQQVNNVGTNPSTRTFGGSLRVGF
jgi:TonB-linked SusC/RagA family outer membrane protein